MLVVLRAVLAVLALACVGLPAPAEAMVRASALKHSNAARGAVACRPVERRDAGSRQPAAFDAAGLTMTGATQTTITLDWNASTDDIGVAGYRVYRDGAVAGTTQETGYTYTGLACGRTYTLAVEAYDTWATPPPAPRRRRRARPRHARVAIRARRRRRSGLTMTGATQSTISLDWNASRDNVGVAGYRLYRDGTVVGTTSRRTTPSPAWPAGGPTRSRSRPTTPPATRRTAPRRPRCARRPHARRPRRRRRTDRDTDGNPDRHADRDPGHAPLDAAGLHDDRQHADVDHHAVDRVERQRRRRRLPPLPQRHRRRDHPADHLHAERPDLRHQLRDRARGLRRRRQRIQPRRGDHDALHGCVRDADADGDADPTPTADPDGDADPTATPTPTPTPAPAPVPAGAGTCGSTQRRVVHPRSRRPAPTRTPPPARRSTPRSRPRTPVTSSASGRGHTATRPSQPRSNTGAQIEFRADGGTVRFGSVNMNGADRITFYGPFAGSDVRANSCLNGASQCLLSRNITWVGLTLDRRLRRTTRRWT